MLKAHGVQGGWTCIWRIVDKDCYLRLANERDLLQHLKSHHVVLGRDARSTKIHASVDLQSLTKPSALSCGFGAKINGLVVPDENYITSKR